MQRATVVRNCLVIPLTASLACSVSAYVQPAPPPPCLQDTDGDGHPLFATIARRGSPAAAFSPSSTITQFRNICVADLDSDGHTDVVGSIAGECGKANKQLGFVVMRGLPDGAFEEGTLFNGIWKAPHQVELADLDGDGHLDLVLLERDTCVVPGKAVVLWGDGTAAASGFTLGGEYPVGSIPLSFELADLNGDGLLDIVTLNHGDDVLVLPSVSVLINAGAGAFFPAQTFATPLSVVSPSFSEGAGPYIEAMDIDQDGDLDLAIPTVDSLRFLLNEGKGNFVAGPQKLKEPNLRTTYAPWSGDLNGDGIMDVTSIQAWNNDQLCVWLGLGGGTYALGAVYGGDQIPSSGRTIVACDVDHDGDIDFATGGRYWGVVVHRNAGDGTFPATDVVLNTKDSYDVALADVDGDQWEDLLVLESWPVAQMVTSRNDRTGRFREPEAVPEIIEVIPNPLERYSYNRVAATDLDNDGDLDLVATTAENGLNPKPLIGLRLNDGDGHWTYKDVGVFPSDTRLTKILPVDLSNDGGVDLVIADATEAPTLGTPGRFWTMLADGTGGFGEPILHAFTDAIPDGLASGDFDGDGDTDVAVWSCGLCVTETTPVFRQIRTYLNDGAGALSPGAALPLGKWTCHTDGSVVATDLDGDGLLDLAATATPLGVIGKVAGPGAVIWARGLGNGQFEVRPPVEVTFMARGLAPLPRAGPGAGLNDLVVGHVSQPGDSLKSYPLEGIFKTILRVEQGDLKVVATHAEPGREHLDRTVVADMNGDGYPDLMGIESGTANASVMLGKFDGTFGSPFTYETGTGAFDVAAGDFNGDGAADLVTVAAFLNDCITILRNEACSLVGCYPDCDRSGELNIDDFICFQTQYAVGNLGQGGADCDGDGQLTIDDFICFQAAYALGC